MKVVADIMSNLKPCPFCGTIPTMIHDEPYPSLYRVRCGFPMCRMDPHTPAVVNASTAKQIWNTRNAMIPLSRDLDALIQRNEERKRVNTEYLADLRSSGFGWPEDGPPDPPPCEPSVIDDIDQLLALIADLQAALSER